MMLVCSFSVILLGLIGFFSLKAFLLVGLFGAAPMTHGLGELWRFCVEVVLDGLLSIRPVFGPLTLFLRARIELLRFNW